MAREMYLVGVSENELRPDPKPEGPKNFKEKWDNYWYHYKWMTIILSTVVVIFAIILFQVITKTRPDYLIAMVTKEIVTSEQSDKLAEELQQYGRDVNKDGKVFVQVETVCVNDSSQYGMIGKQKLVAHFSSGDVMFYIFDKESYDQNVRALLDKTGIGEFFSKIDTEAEGIDQSELCWNWINAPIRSDPVMKNLPSNMYFGIRSVGGTAASESSRKVHDECMALLKAYITKTPLTDKM